MFANSISNYLPPAVTVFFFEDKEKVFGWNKLHFFHFLSPVLCATEFYFMICTQIAEHAFLKISTLHHMRNFCVLRIVQQPLPAVSPGLCSGPKLNILLVGLLSGKSNYIRVAHLLPAAAAIG